LVVIGRFYQEQQCLSYNDHTPCKGCFSLGSDDFLCNFMNVLKLMMMHRQGQNANDRGHTQVLCKEKKLSNNIFLYLVKQQTTTHSNNNQNTKHTLLSWWP
jgi:hypothetical protein